MPRALWYYCANGFSAGDYSVYAYDCYDYRTGGRRCCNDCGYTLLSMQKQQESVSYADGVDVDLGGAFFHARRIYGRDYEYHRFRALLCYVQPRQKMGGQQNHACAADCHGYRRQRNRLFIPDDAGFGCEYDYQRAVNVDKRQPQNPPVSAFCCFADVACI